MKSNRHRTYLMRAGLVAFVALFARSPIYLHGRGQSISTNGKELFEKRCSGCHAMDRDKEGPRLSGVYGREAAAVPSFEYSAALKASKLKWTDESLDRWLRDPEKLVPSNDMTFHVESADERHALIAYLKQNPGK